MPDWRYRILIAGNGPGAAILPGHGEGSSEAERVRGRSGMAAKEQARSIDLVVGFCERGASLRASEPSFRVADF